MFHLPILFQSGLLSEMRSRRNKSDYLVSRELMAIHSQMAQPLSEFLILDFFMYCTCISLALRCMAFSLAAGLVTKLLGDLKHRVGFSTKLGPKVAEGWARL